MITPQQLRAARGILDWSRDKCGDVVGLSSATIKNIETGVYTPAPETIEKILKGFAEHGVSFFTQHGVALKEVEQAVTEC